MDMPARRTHPMPEVAAFVASLRKAFGDAVVDEAIQRSKAEEPTFFARENGHTVGTPAPTNAWVVDRTIIDRHFCHRCDGVCVSTGQRCSTQYPELRGQAVVIGGGRNATPETLPDGTRRFARLRDYVGRGVATTSTYEARALGVFSAMGMMKAAQLAPDAILLPTDFDSYRHYSQLFKNAVRTFTGQIEDRGIDEIYIDLTDVDGDSGEIGSQIKAAVSGATDLTCSIAIAPNKLLAKIGSELDKPDGLTILTMADLETRIWPLAVKKVNGIGPRASERLASVGIATVGELAAADLGLLQEHFGRTYATWLARVAQGLDERDVVVSSEPKSMSRETTFERDMHARKDRAVLTPALTALCERVAGDLERKGYGGRTVGVKIKYEDFKIVTRDLSLSEPVADAIAIRRAVNECLKRVLLDRRIRLIGVRVSALTRPAADESAAPSRQGELPFDN